ncbi:MAG: hypothetical protein IPM60_15755 [Rhodospirillales bacterium]|nr:hypothetical protein [Rhodospirillales bacterium]
MSKRLISFSWCGRVLMIVTTFGIAAPLGWSDGLAAAFNSVPVGGVSDRTTETIQLSEVSVGLSTTASGSCASAACLLEAARSHSNGSPHHQALLTAAQAFVDPANLEHAVAKALSAAAKLEDPERARTLEPLAFALAEAGFDNLAGRVEQASPWPDSLREEEVYYLLEKGKVAEATKTLDRMKMPIRRLRVLVALVRKDKSLRTSQNLMAVEDLVNLIQDPEWRPRALLKLAQAQAAMANLDEARATLRQATDAALPVSDRYVLSDIAQTWAEFGDVETALGIASHVPRDGRMNLAAIAIAAVLARDGELEKAERIMDSAGADEEAGNFSGLARDLIESGQLEAARHFIDNKLDDADSLRWALAAARRQG